MVNLVAAGGELNVAEAMPHRVREIEHQWIAMPDGVRLAARIWLPENADQHPVPAIVEYIPYRKRDFTLPRDELIHPWYAGHGYAAIRLDIRSSGDSEGLAHGRIYRPGAGRHARCACLDRRPTMVQRFDRHDRHLLGAGSMGSRSPCDGHLN